MDYITQMRVLANFLVSIGVLITEKDIVTQLCIGLPQDYMSITTSISAHLPLPSFFETRSLLLNSEAKLKSFSSITTDTSQASFYTPKQPSSGPTHGYRGRGGR
ncbi:hypothetical protein LIER_01452 [Lithospermum erythrorhizon]|uniref:Uncharacterized protein n=1 Tax=Lithospermum erythrorhizon TaxID=34254 RepID=A0AAV3NKX7_LITER